MEKRIGPYCSPFAWIGVIRGYSNPKLPNPTALPYNGANA